MPWKQTGSASLVGPRDIGGTLRLRCRDSKREEPHHGLVRCEENVHGQLSTGPSPNIDEPHSATSLSICLGLNFPCVTYAVIGQVSEDPRYEQLAVKVCQLVLLSRAIIPCATAKSSSLARSSGSPGVLPIPRPSTSLLEVRKYSAYT